MQVTTNLTEHTVVILSQVLVGLVISNPEKHLRNRSPSEWSGKAKDQRRYREKFTRLSNLILFRKKSHSLIIKKVY